MPCGLRGLLHRALHLLADSRHARGQAAGVRCVQLRDDSRCAIFGDPARPAVCGSLMPRDEMCGETREFALAYLGRLEELTR